MLDEHIESTFINYGLPNGHMVQIDENDYKDLFPDNLFIPNARICVRTSDKGVVYIWRGHLDINKEANNLHQIALALGYDLDIRDEENDQILTMKG